MDDMVEQYQIPAEAAQVELAADLQKNVYIRADKTQMERLVSNLLSNAIKYTPEGGKVRIALVSDHAIGPIAERRS